MRVRELFPADAVCSRIAELAQQLARYADAPFVIVCIDRGAVRFVEALVAALARHPRGWVVGFGMDLDGSFRELDFVGVVVDPRF